MGLAIQEDRSHEDNLRREESRDDFSPAEGVVLDGPVAGEVALYGFLFFLGKEPALTGRSRHQEE